MSFLIIHLTTIAFKNFLFFKIKYAQNCDQIGSYQSDFFIKGLVVKFFNFF